MPCRRRFLFFLLSFLIPLASSVLAAPGYRLLKTVPLGGEGGWDYLTLDAEARRLYVSRGSHVVVLDADSLAPVGEIPDTPGVHGVALAKELGRGFTSNGRAATATIFELATLRVLGQVKTGGNPDAILYDGVSHRVFTFNGASGDATAFDGATGGVAGTVALGGRPEFAVADGHGQVFVNLEDKAELLRLDAKDLAVRSRWPLAPCEEPTGLALDAEHRRLFVGCGNRLMAVVDADGGHVVATLPIGRGVDATAFDAARGLAFSSNGEGTLTVVREESPDRFRVAETVTTQPGARTMALDPKTHRIFLATARFGPPPPPSPDHPHPRGGILPGTFMILLVGE